MNNLASASAESVISPPTLAIIRTSQKTEITEHLIYKKLANTEKNSANKKILTEIAADELEHYEFWKKITKTEAKANIIRVWSYFLIAKTAGITFGVKLMERGEEEAQMTYSKIAHEVPETKQIIEDEDRHEQQLISLINEERLQYIGAIVLGLNDALVELTGALAGFTLALQQAQLIAVAGLITGIAASFSMAASNYLSIKAQKDGRNPYKSALYTGIAYLVTVALLVIPYLILGKPYISLIISLAIALLIILTFTFYSSVADGGSFKKKFTEMATISLSVALLSFLIGLGMRLFFRIDI